VRGPVRWVVKGVAIVVMVIAVVVLLGVAVMWLWNALVPALFRGPTLQYWQALGLLLLSRLLFGGWRGGVGRHGRWRQHRWRERWEQMTPEERARLREMWLSRCGNAADAGPASAPHA
jgi:Ca2+/H+ antiporter, TMEM165/GDT1 family